MSTTFESSDTFHPLNNGYLCAFTDGQRRFVSVEQFMMWKKATTFPGNEEVASKILETHDSVPERMRTTSDECGATIGRSSAHSSACLPDGAMNDWSARF